MSKRSHRRARRQPPPSTLPAPAKQNTVPPHPAEPDRLLLDQIAAGALDPHLTAISQAIRARYELLHTIDTAKALAQLNIGDDVRINRHAKPRYLQGVHGTIVDLDDHTATVCMHRPIGRFTSGEIRCPPLILDKLGPSGLTAGETMSPAHRADPEIDSLTARQGAAAGDRRVAAGGHW
jgi:hypothetical protein